MFAAALFAVVALWPGTSSAATYRWVALGDSYSSGEGLGPFLAGTNTTKDRCHRSSRAYPLLLEQKPTVFAACSGATIRSYWVPQSEPAQRSRLNGSESLVTVTIGGNDLGWTKILRDCSKIQTPKIPGSLGGTACASKLNPETVAASIASMKKNLVTLYRDILLDSPRADVRVLLYPPIFPDRGNTTATCRIARIGASQLVLDAATVKRFVSLQQQANDAIWDAVEQVREEQDTSRIRAIDVEKVFGGYGTTGHTISCGSTGRPTPWINGVRLSAAQTARLAFDIRTKQVTRLGLDLFNVYSASFHPTVDGQKQMAAALSDSVG